MLQKCEGAAVDGLGPVRMGESAQAAGKRTVVALPTFA